MTLWSIQTVEAYDNLQKNKIIYGDSEFVEGHFLVGYDWLVKQMEKKIGKRPFPGCYPIWAWYQWHSQKRRKPDLRSRHLPEGTKGVRIQIEKNEREVLLSDYHLWHFPLSYCGYIGNSEQDDLAFDKSLKEASLYDAKFEELPGNLKITIERSWDKIFDMEFDDPYYTYKKEEKSIQASFWSLSIDEVVRVDEFIAR